MMVQFSVAGRPKTKGSWRAFMIGGKARLIPDNKRSKPWEKKVALRAREAMAGRRPIRGPVRIDAVYYFRRPVSHFKKSGDLSAAGRRNPLPAKKSTGDRDKLDRCIKDAMTGVVYRDDSQDVSGGSSKEFAVGRGGLECALITVMEVE